ncbi:beta strand repeat-containing protein [Limnoglobus roseus]|uniref:Beta-propeller repeat protein n=1 Tax=Limnoglobus roseus TaxID=2598579 RepID=A0A5C1A626_9BACT|nr:tandem-95 repeat protein [Limnoglobus roseus]QEL13436.1 beta-propeller repeat protein [Limnoglobus roseus]
MSHRSRSTNRKTPALPATRPQLQLLEGRDVPATFTVTNNLDALPSPNAPAGSLRQAIIDAENSPGLDTIQFATGVTSPVVLAGTLPTITQDLVINGLGSSLTTIDGGNQFRIFNIAGPANGVNLVGIRFFQGKATGGNGGAIQTTAPLNLFDTVFDSNQATQVTLPPIPPSPPATTGGFGGAISATAQVNLTDTTFINNQATVQGGAISGTRVLSATNVNAPFGAVFTTNKAATGGAVFITDFLSPLDAGFSFTGNKALAGDGGAVATTNTAVLQIDVGSIFQNNTATGNGGAIAHKGVDFARSQFIRHSLFTGNQAGGTGGAIYYSQDLTVIPANGLNVALNIVNDTFTGNQAGTSGGAISVQQNENIGQNNRTGAAIDFVTITGNSAAFGGGVAGASSGTSIPVSLTNSIVVNNTAPTSPNLNATLRQSGGNLIGTSTGGSGYVASDRIDETAPGLGTLSNNGGATQTIPLLAGSPALGLAGTPGPFAFSRDQRDIGLIRPTGGPLDAGAFQARPPAGVADSFTTPFNTTLTRSAATGLIVPNDTAGEPTVAALTATNVSALSNPAAGALTVNPDGSFSFVPTSGFSGSVTFTYTATDVRSTAPITATITVAAPNAVVAANDAYSTPFNTALVVPIRGTPPNVLANDSGGNAQLTATLVTPPTAAQGTLTFNTNGSFTFTPTNGFTGNASFTYTATDGFTTSNPAIVTIAVGASTTITTAADNFTTPFETVFTQAAPGVLANDSGGSGALTAALVTPPAAAQGTVTVSPNGSFTFKPALGFSGTASFAYAATDGFTTSSPTTVTITVGVTPTTVTFAVSEGAGGQPIVKTYRPDGTFIREFVTMDPGFDGGVRAATGDVNGDGFADLVVGAGPGGAPRVQVFDGKTGSILFDFFAYETSFTNGVFVALGDVTGDGRADVVVGAGSLGGPRVRVLDGNGFGLVQDFFAYDPSFRGGVRVAVGDVTGDGKAEIVTGAGVSGAPHIRVLDGTTLGEQAGFFADDSNYRGGVFVSVVDGIVVTSLDSVPDFTGTVLETIYPTLPNINGQSSGRSPLAGELALPAVVRTFSISGGRAVAGPSVTPFGTDFLGGVRVGSGGLVNGSPTIVVAPGIGGPGVVKRYAIGGTTVAAVPSGSGSGLVRRFAVSSASTLAPIGTDFDPFIDFNGSIYVGSAGESLAVPGGYSAVEVSTPIGP